jgi:phage terminase small subunit
MAIHACQRVPVQAPPDRVIRERQQNTVASVVAWYNDERVARQQMQRREAPLAQRGNEPMPVFAAMALTAKQEAFAHAVAKGENASDAYRAAYDAKNMSAAAIHVAACRLLKDPKIVLRVEELRAPAVKTTRLEIEEILCQLACVLRSDARRLFRPDGTLIPVRELDDATAAAISSIDLDEKGRPKKIRLWSKTDAIDKAMRHLGLFERDNGQRMPNLAIQVNLVGPEPKPVEAQAKTLL